MGRLLCKDPEIEYNDLAQWHYADLPKALGSDDWFTARVTTSGEFDQALKAASQGDRGAYIEIVTDKYAASTLPMRLHENLKTLYGKIWLRAAPAVWIDRRKARKLRWRSSRVGRFKRSGRNKKGQLAVTGTGREAFSQSVRLTLQERVFFYVMRRFLANLALAAILNTFILPLAAAFEIAATPACCLPDGKHHCNQSPTGPGFKTQNDKCPYHSQIVATGATAIGSAKFDLAGLDVSGHFGQIAAQVGHPFGARELSARGPPISFL